MMPEPFLQLINTVHLSDLFIVVVAWASANEFACPDRAKARQPARLGIRKNRT